MALYHIKIFSALEYEKIDVKRES